MEPFSLRETVQCSQTIVVFLFGLLFSFGCLCAKRIKRIASSSSEADEELLGAEGKEETRVDDS